MAVGRTSEPRTATVVTTILMTTITGAAGTFNEEDAGRPITGTGIPASTTLATITSDTAADMTAAATATGSRTVTIGSATSGAADALSYGFVGWSPETDAESETYTATGLGTSEPSRITNPYTAVTYRGRS